MIIFTFNFVFTGITEDAHWRFLAHEQAAAVLHLISFQNPSCQAELITAGAIKYLVGLCDVFNPEGCHSNCCKSICKQSIDASRLFYDLTYKKKLVGKVKEMTVEEIRDKAVKLIRNGEIFLLNNKLIKGYRDLIIEQLLQLRFSLFHC